MADCYTELEKAVVVLVENFYKYVSKHSLVKNKISRASFRKMLQRELNHMLTVAHGRPRSLSALLLLTLLPVTPPLCALLSDLCPASLARGLCLGSCLGHPKLY